LTPSTLLWQAGLTYSEADLFSADEIIDNPFGYLGKTVTEARRMCIGLASAMLLLMLALMLAYRLLLQPRLPAAIEEEQRARKKYKDLIVDVDELPPTGDMIMVSMSSLEELLNAAQGLLR